MKKSPNLKNTPGIRRFFSVAGNLRLLPLALSAPALLLASCRQDFENTGNTGEKNAESQHRRVEPHAKRIGQIARVDETGKHAVVWLDRNTGIGKNQTLLTRDEALRPQARLRATGERDGRAIGVVAETGTIEPDREVVIPDQTMLEALEKNSAGDDRR